MWNTLLPSLEQNQLTGQHHERHKYRPWGGNIEISDQEKNGRREKWDNTTSVVGQEYHGIREGAISEWNTGKVTLPPLEEINSKMVHYSRVIKESWMGRDGGVIVANAPVHMQPGAGEYPSSSISQGLQGNGAPGWGNRGVPVNSFQSVFKSSMKSSSGVNVFGAKKPLERELPVRIDAEVHKTETANAFVGLKGGQPPLYWVPKGNDHGNRGNNRSSWNAMSIGAGTSRPPGIHNSVLPISMVLEEQRSRFMASFMKIRGELIKRHPSSSIPYAMPQRHPPQSDMKMPPSMVAGQNLPKKRGNPSDTTPLKRATQAMAAQGIARSRQELVLICDGGERFVVELDLLVRVSPVVRGFCKFKPVPEENPRFMLLEGPYPAELVETLLNYLNGDPFNPRLMGSSTMKKLTYMLKISVKTDFKTCTSKR